MMFHTSLCKYNTWMTPRTKAVFFTYTTYFIVFITLYEMEAEYPHYDFV